MSVVNPVFGVNDYNKPKFLTAKESYMTDVLMILLGKPGFYPSIPSLGMDIHSLLYKFEDEIDPDGIKSELIAQCNELDENIEMNSIEVVTTNYNGQLMLIFVLPVIDDTKEVYLALGISLNEKGDIIFKYNEIKDPNYIK